jgi:outer membrane protein TolC
MIRTLRSVVLAGCLAWATTSYAQGEAPPILTLGDALQYALEHYPAVRVAIAQVTTASANVSAAKAAYLPRFDSMWQTNRATANNIYGQLLPQSVMPAISGPVLAPSSQAVWGSAVAGLLSWEPVDFGLRDAMVRQADAGVARARADDEVTRLDVQHAVASAYLNVLTAQQALTAADADVQRRDVLARAVHTLVDNQLRPGAEASRADAERAAAQTRAIQARQAVTLAKNTLARVLGLPGGAIEINAAALLAAVPPPEAASTAIAQHPLVQSAQAAIEQARAEETVLSKTDWPRLYLQSSVSARGSGANPDGVFDGGAGGLGLERVNWAAGLQIVVPNLFDFSSLRARRAAAAARTDIESARHDEAVLSVTADQRDADAMVDAARAIAQNTPIQLAAARQGERQARARYEAGLTGLVELADAQNLLVAAEYQDASARVEVWRALLTRATAQGSMQPFIDLVRAARSQ